MWLVLFVMSSIPFSLAHFLFIKCFSVLIVIVRCHILIVDA